MFRIKVTLCVVVAYIMLLGVCETAERKANYVRDVTFDGRSCFIADTALSVGTRTLVQCSALCTVKKCARIFYNPSTGICSGCYTLYDSTQWLPFDSGSIAYMYHFECENDQQGRFNTSCYEIQPTLMSWYAAQAHCASTTNGHLLVPESIEEYHYLIAWFPGQIVFYAFVHIGYTDEAEEGNWVSVLGKPLGFLPPWGVLALFPNTDFNCVYLDIFHVWNSGLCVSEIHVICERDMIPM